MRTVRSRQHPRPHRRRAFSLIEITCVVMTIGIVTAIVVGRYGQAVARYRANAAARRIVADLAFAQARAKATSSSQTVTLVSTTRYELAGVPDPQKPTTTYAVDLSAEPYSSSLVLTSIPAGSSLVFNGCGVPVGLPSGGVQIVVRSGDESVTVSIDADTGQGSVQ